MSALIMINTDISGDLQIAELFKQKINAPITTQDSSQLKLVTDFPDDSNQPLKTGWLLKKRDILTGWKGRYFKVIKENFPGRH